MEGVELGGQKVLGRHRARKANLVCGMTTWRPELWFRGLLKSWRPRTKDKNLVSEKVGENVFYAVNEIL